jgi:flagellar hook protein FlgE
MSLYGSMVSGILGLQAQTQAMSMISDNIANVNTVGYKRTGPSFSTLVTSAATKTSYTPGGVQVRPQQYIANQGVLGTSTTSTNVAISGQGFFVVSTQPVAGTANGGAATLPSGASIGYTRAGDFGVDDNGNLVNSAGYYLQGWPAIPPNYSSFNTSLTTSQLSTINVGGLSGNAVASSEITARINLQASTTADATYNFGDMGTYINSGGTSGTAPDFQRTFQVYDSQGTARSVTYAFQKTGTNQWAVEVYADLDGNGTQDLVNSAASQTNASSLMTFNSDGTLDTANSTFLTNNTPLAINWNASLGIDTPQNITQKFGTNGLADGFTQNDQASSLVSSNVNGSVAGTFTGVSIGDDGIVKAMFDNGTSRAIAQIPLVTFPNPNGLRSGSGNVYFETQESGSGNINVSGTGGSGAISSNALEQSTVDLATEFTNMIVTQRAYSANSKTIQTVDDMLSEIINLKR